MNWLYTVDATKTRPMRVLKAIYLAGLFTLAMGLFCGELPESLRLVDDTTNDYVADSSASAAHESEVAQVVTAAQEAATTEAYYVARTGSVSTSLAPSRVSGKDLLTLISIRRT